MLWVAIQALLAAYGDRVHAVVYSGDAGTDGTAILARARDRFNLVVPADRVTFVFLRRRGWVEAARYPFVTMLGQSLGSLVLGWEALCAFAPDILLDTMGYAFILPLFRLVGLCEVGCYVHYPTISTDMLQRVSAREHAFNNTGAIARSPFLSMLKVLYYRAFAVAYGLAGCDCAMTRSRAWPHWLTRACMHMLAHKVRLERGHGQQHVDAGPHCATVGPPARAAAAAHRLPALRHDGVCEAL